ncbi:MAG: TatD family hydrolase [Bacteroidetes bacterium]|nr:TatD family hydrolase [Bacteroidota bacterium]
MVRLIDTHSHLFVADFDNDRAEVIKRAKEAGVEKVFLPNIDFDSIIPMNNLSAEYADFCYSMIALHPCDVKENYEEILDKIEKELFENQSKYFGIGETGIDLYWDKSTFDIQVKSFERHISWSRQTKLPIIIHARDSINELIEILSKPKNKDIIGVFHCFTGDLEQAKKIIDLGFYLGIGGVLTYKKSGLDEVLKILDLNRIVLETDSPYLAPVPMRGKRNESSFIRHVAEKLAEIKGVTVEDIGEITSQNACKLFGV